jgi:hypothetical protein
MSGSTLAPNCLNVTGETTLGRLGDLIVPELKRLGLWEELDYFNMDFQIEKNTQLRDILPEHFNWISVWAVPGGSEGHYVHVELVGACESLENCRQSRKLTRCIFLGKTFMGMDHALALVGALTRMLSW